MTIAIVTEIYPPLIGGAGAVMHSLAVRAPEKIAIVTNDFDPDGNRIEDQEPHASGPDRVIRIRRFSNKLKYLPRGKFRAVCQAAYGRFLLHPQLTRDLLRVLQQLSPKMVCIGTLAQCYWVVSAIRKWRPEMKVLIYAHGEEIPPAKGAGYFDKLRLQALQNASAIVAVSSFTKNTLVNLGIPSERITVITNGVDTDRFQPGEKCPRLVDRYGLANRRVLLTLARLDERKGQDKMIRAMPIIRKAVPDAVYLVVGEGSHGETLRKLVADLKLEDAVVFTGASSDAEVVDYYQSCDVYVMPNRTLENGDTEGFGLVFLEAGACGKPVIGGLAGGVPDAILQGVTGLLVDGTSTEAIANACIQLLQDADLRHEFGVNGLAHASRNDWKWKTEQFLALCDNIVAKENHSLPSKN